MSRLETAELEYLLTLADELSFTSAAARLGMAQPALSRAVARIERRLGTALFVRTTRSVTPTAAGETLVTGARQVLADLDRIVVATRAQDRDRPLQVALRPGAGSGLLADTLGRWRGPEITVVPADDPVATVRAGLADLALACRTDDLHGLLVEELDTRPTVVLVPRGHPLTRSRGVTLRRVETTEGFQRRCPAVPLAEIVDRVAFTGLVVLAASDVVDRLGPDVRAMPVLDAPSITFCAARRRGRGHPAATGFVEHLRDTTVRAASA